MIYLKYIYIIYVYDKYIYIYIVANLLGNKIEYGVRCIILLKINEVMENGESNEILLDPP